MADAAQLMAFGLSAFAAIFTIVNPVGNLPLYVTLTEGFSPQLKRLVVRRAVTVATATLLLFALAGNTIFLAFHTSIHAFRIAGGALLFSIAFAMMQGERPKAKLTDRERDETLGKETVGVVPLGIPLFAGPGAITTVMVLMASASEAGLDLLRAALVLLSILVTMAISSLLLARSDRLFARFGRTGMMAFTRIMGLLLAAIAVQFILLGVQGAWLEYFVGALG